ncbi:cellulase family glycosylhydrolase [candidate division WOR-3 bacterium]|nr:cellulase family glycosylhydrolase [candidate division WOR-3 bacterium]
MNLKRTIFIISITTIAFSCGCGGTETTGPTTSTTTTSGSIINPATPGLEGCGVNLQPSYFCNGDMDLGWDLMDNYNNIKTLRIELDSSTSSTIDDFVRWLSEANNNGYDVIATYHYASVLGSNDPNQLLAAANWWVENWDTLSSAGSFTVNLMNEWGDHSITSEAYANAYNAAIDTLRQVYDGPLICDIPGWGQETHTAADASTDIEDEDIIFSVHIYTNGWNGKAGHPLCAADLDYLETAGRPCMVGEFGNGGGGSVDWSALVDHARGKGWSVIGWSWNGDGGGMNMISPYWGADCNTTSYIESSYFYTIYNKLGPYYTTSSGSTTTSN